MTVKTFFKKNTAVPCFLTSPVWTLLGIFFLLPLCNMLWTSFQQRGTYGGIRPVEDAWQYILSAGFLQNYARSLEWIYLQISARSFWMAASTTLLCLLVSYPVAYCIAFFTGSRWKNFLLVLVVIPFWTSFLIRTYAWVFILRSEGFLNT